jgi:glutathione synthase/RimK-type ligase-like ATP-grasp enzyme
MNPRVAIHRSEGSFSDRWIEYCAEHGVAYEVVNCYDSGILGRLASANALLWHWSHGIAADLLMAHSIIRSAETMGLKVFPSTATCWHFDDKVAQKYLLEAVGAPLVPAHVFFDLETAFRWIDQAAFPKVFKLRRGAGSMNVRLVRSAAEARRLARRAFGRGFKAVGRYFVDAPTRLRKVRRRGDLLGALKRLPRTFWNGYRSNLLIGRERGYVYFQDFMPDNLFDTRVTVIGNRAFGFTRNVRPRDFRASGSGSIDYDLKRIDPQCVRIAFDTAARIGSQSTAFDFVRSAGGQPQIVEISYGYLASAVYNCVGHWDSDLRWHEGHVWPQDAILEDLLAEWR